MRVELIYDKRNVAGLENAGEIIQAELTKRVHRVFPSAEIKVKAMQANGINIDANKQEKAVLNHLIDEMFEGADEWLVAEICSPGAIYQGQHRSLPARCPMPDARCPNSF